METLKYRTLIVSLFLVVNSVGIAGQNKEEQTVTGKVVTYVPQNSIVIQTATQGIKEFNISKQTTLADQSGVRVKQLDLNRGSSVRIETKTIGDFNAKRIQPTPDVGGPDYNPPPHK